MQDKQGACLDPASVQGVAFAMVDATETYCNARNIQGTIAKNTLCMRAALVTLQACMETAYDRSKPEGKATIKAMLADIMATELAKSFGKMK